MKTMVMMMTLLMGTLQIGAEETKTPAEAVDVGNTQCPVSGREKDGEHVYVHNGKQYNLCGGDCMNEFAKDPEKYAQIGDQSASAP